MSIGERRWSLEAGPAAQQAAAVVDATSHDCWPKGSAAPALSSSSSSGSGQSSSTTAQLLRGAGVHARVGRVAGQMQELAGLARSGAGETVWAWPLPRRGYWLSPIGLSARRVAFGRT